MWEMGNFWPGEAGNSSTNSMAQSSYLSIMNEIHVLVVDHDTNHLINTVHLLELCHYRVSVAELASRAIQMLLIGKMRFDFILANLNSPDLHGYKLLQQAVAMDIPLIVMSNDDSAFLTLKALENGAFLCVKKPTTMDMLKGLWLHVAREKIRKTGEKNRFVGSNYNAGGIEFREVIHPANGNPNNLGCNNTLNLNNNIGGINSMLMLDKHVAPHKDNYAAGISGVREGNYQNNYLFNAKVKRKACTEWTQELHEKFMAAVRQLGEGRCFPKEILELMNVPGLTRMQVASHLQKCRNDNWRSPDDRISNPNSQNVSSDHADHAVQQKPRRFGSMPKICVKMTTDTDGGTYAGEGSKTPDSGTKAVQVEGGIGSMVVDPPTITTNNDNDNNITNKISTNAPHPPSPPPPPPPPYRQGSMVVPPPMRGTPDEFLTFTGDMDGTVQNNYSVSSPHLSARMTNTVDNESSGDVYHLESNYRHHAQNSGAPSVDDRSHWSSEATSNAGSDHDSESTGR